MSTIYRVQGDNGTGARIRVLGLRNADGDLIESGDVTIRAGGLFEGAMVSDGAGDWHYDPLVTDLDAAGKYLLEVRIEGSQVTIPGKFPWRLNVRAAVDPPGGSP